MKFMKIKKNLLAVLLVTLLSTSIATADVATAAPTNATAGWFTRTELNQIESQIDFIFTELIIESDGIWAVDEPKAAIAKVPLSDLRIIAESMNSSAPSPRHAFGSEKWTKCVINFTGFGSVYSFFSGSLRADLRAKRYKRPALAIIKIVGRSAVRGGVAGLVASLAAGAAWCSTSWAQ